MVTAAAAVAVAKNVRLSIVASLEVFSCSLIDSELLPTSIFLTRNCRSDDAIVASRSGGNVTGE